MSASDPRCFACHSCCGAWTEEGSLRVFVKKRPLSLKLHGGGDEWEYLETMLDSGATVTVIPLLAQVWDFFAVRYFAANASARRGAWLDVVILADMLRACKLKSPMCPTLCSWGECLSKRDTSWCSAMETKATGTASTTRRLASQTPSVRSWPREGSRVWMREEKKMMTCLTLVLMKKAAMMVHRWACLTRKASMLRPTETQGIPQKHTRSGSNHFPCGPAVRKLVNRKAVEARWDADAVCKVRSFSRKPGGGRTDRPRQLPLKVQVINAQTAQSWSSPSTPTCKGRVAR